VLSAENKKLVSDLLRVIKEAAFALRELGLYYRSLQAHLAGLEKTLETIRPSDEELRMVQQSWADLRTSLSNLPNELSDELRVLERLPPIVYHVDDPRTSLLPGFAKPTTTQEIRADHAPHRGQLLWAGTKAAASRTRSAAKTFWRSLQVFFRHLIPRFTPNSRP
jgi:hypothetical protein